MPSNDDLPPAYVGNDDATFATAFAWNVNGLARLLWRWFAIDALLRLVWLVRPDPFGQPLVGKVDWYYFHALGLDLQQGLALALPSLLLLTLAAWWNPQDANAHWTWPARILVWLSVLMTVASLVDAEHMRFSGAHFSLAMTKLYGNGASLHELPRLLGSDAGGPYLGAVLLLLGVGGLVWWQDRVLPGFTGKLPKAALGYGLAALLGWLWTSAIWPGDAREWKLLPPLTVLRQELGHARRAPQPPEVAERAAYAAQDRWRRAHPQNPSVFAVPDHPLVHLTPRAACNALSAGKIAALPGVDCSADGDGDGFKLADDCDDRRADLHPGAEDLPSDGVDQDCSGIDEKPWNVLVIAMESHRSLGVGHVTGGPTWSPRLDELAARGYAQRRTLANGLPTIASFMALHTSTLPCAWCTVATDFTAARLPSLPDTLRQYGYYTRFFSAADPAWDNQRAWLRHWYDDIDYDRSREEDAELFAHMGRWLRQDLQKTAGGKPFFVFAMTRTNHFPFPRVAGVPNNGGDSWPERMRDTMGYADAEMGKLLDQLAKEAWFKRTLVIVTGDHGFPLGEHGAMQLYQTIHVEATGVPLVFAGDHPRLRPLRGKVDDRPSSHIDLAPTVLDLLGIDDSGAWMGRSLLTAGEADTLTVKDGNWSIERGYRRLIIDGKAPDQPASWRAFHRGIDPKELQPLKPEAGDKALAAELTDAARWLFDVYSANQVLPPWWGK